MLEELQPPDYSHRIARTYIRIVRDFAAFFHRPPDKPRAGTHPPIPGGSVSKQKAKSCRRLASVKYVSALRFWYDKTLRQHFLTEHIPFPKIAPLVSDLRCFLRFLTMRGILQQDLSAQLPKIRVRRDATIPSVLHPELVA
jgi:hypothetical protein